MFKVNTDNEYKAVERVYSGSTEIDKILDKNGNVLFAVNKEVEGTPALTYTGKEETNLKNYRIYGNTVNGESVGDLITEGEHAGEYRVPVTVEGKNLLPTITASYSSMGILIRSESDGTVIVSGTATAKIFANLRENISYPFDTILSGCPQGGSTEGYCLRLITMATPSIVGTDFGNGTLIPANTEVRIEIRIENGCECNNLKFKPMIRKADIEDDTYEPYHAPVTTPIYLPEPIKMVGDEAEYVDYGQQKQHRVRKNLWSGVVEQGAVSQLGDYISNTKRIRSKNVPIEPGTYAISSNLLLLVIYAFNDTQKIGLCASIYQGSHSYTITVPAGANNISIGMMKVVDGVQVDITPSDFEWGQVEKGSEVTNYEPYIENTEVNVTIPALPTISGTNTLSVGTEVQPSNVYLKGRIKEVSV